MNAPQSRSRLLAVLAAVAAYVALLLHTSLEPVVVLAVGFITYLGCLAAAAWIASSGAPGPAVHRG